MQSGWERFSKGDAKVLNLNNGKDTVAVNRHEEGSGGSTGLEEKNQKFGLGCVKFDMIFFSKYIYERRGSYLKYEFGSRSTKIVLRTLIKRVFREGKRSEF